MNIDIQKIQEKLKTNLSHKRYIHSVGTAEVAKKLAIKYNADSEKAYLAGLLHDSAKEISLEKMNQLIDSKGIAFNDLARKSKAILHGPAGSILIEEEYNIFDEEIQNAIFYHTTGKPDMSVLEKIIFLADYIEPSRDFPGVDELRKTADQDLNKAVIAAYNSTIKFLLDKNEYIYELTFFGRNYLICEQDDKYKK